MKINLTEDELHQLVTQINEFNDLHQRLNKVQSQITALEGVMENLRDENSNCILDVELARANEKMMMAKFVDKYGEGKIDLSDLCWITTLTN